jgi:4-carboxymuconolactone decarboxylase
MMATPRLSPLDPPYSPEITALFDRALPPGMAPLKLFRTLARNERVCQRFFAGALLDRGSIGLEEREIVILRSCARCGSSYEWGVHVTIFAERAGLDAAQIAATVQGDTAAPCWTPRQKLLISLVDSLHDTAQLPAPLWQALAEDWSSEQLIELVLLAGYYHTVSFLTNAFRIEDEAYGAAFPIVSPG